MKLISIVFSFKNEEKNIPELIDRTTKVLTKFSHWNYELIFVNDNSTDNSEQILIKLQKDYPIDIINMSRTYGENKKVRRIKYKNVCYKFSLQNY